MGAAQAASAARRKCGVRRREPLCGATGVYSMKGVPAKSEILRGWAQPRPLLRPAASAASDAGSPCAGRPESIQSMWPPQNRRFCGDGRSPGRFCGPPQVWRPTQGAPLRDDRSLFNERGPRKSAAFMGCLNTSPCRRPCRARREPQRRAPSCRPPRIRWSGPWRRWRRRSAGPCG